MQILEIMSRHVKTISEYATLSEAARTMKESNVGILPVLNSLNNPIGVITDRDIVTRALANHIGVDALVHEAMSPIKFLVRQTEGVSRALDLMREHRVGRLVVTDNGGSLVGVVSFHDAAMHCEDRNETRNVHCALRDRVPRVPEQKFSMA